MKRTPLALCLRTLPAILLALCINQAEAQTFTWLPTSGGLFNTAANWTPALNAPPSASGELALYTGTTTQTVTLETSITLSGHRIENGNITYQLNQTTQTMTAGAGLVVGAVAGQTGRFTILNGTMTGDMTLGNAASSIGFFTIGADALFDAAANTIQVGGSANSSGTLSIINGGDYTGTSALVIGSGGSSNGTALITGAGSSLTAGSTTVGDQGVGELTVSAGASASVLATSVGNAATGAGELTVTGVGSTLTTGNQVLSVGAAGSGVLSITSAGSLACGTSRIATVAGSTGAAAVSGAGSRWTAGSLAVGGSLGANGGTGTLLIADAGAVNVSGNMEIRSSAGSAVTIDGGTLTVSGSFTKNGTLNLLDGMLHVTGTFDNGTVTAPLVIDGTAADALPTLRLSGAAGTLSEVTSVTVGSVHRGALIVDGERTINMGANNLAIGAGTLASGSVTLVGTSTSLATTGTINVGGTLGGVSGGEGALNIHNGATVTTASLNLFTQGTLQLDGGTLNLGALILSSGTFAFSRGTVNFTGANTTFQAGIADALFGLGHVIKPGQSLSATNTLQIGTPVFLDGGSLTAGSLVNQSRLELRSGSLGTIQNDGLLLGDGLVTGTVTNTTTGRIRVDAGDTLSFIGTIAPNAGQVTLQGGTIEYAGNLTNSATGFISGRGAIFSGSVTNNGQMAFSGGTMDIFGDCLLNAGSRVVTSGAGSITTFWDDVLHNGTEIFTGVNCSTIFYGSQSGAGPFTGTGTIYFIGDLRPGNSPAAVTYAPQVIFAPSTALTLEIGGLTAGTQHDKLTFTHAATPQVEWGGTLTVTLINGFTPAAGQSFDVFDFDAARAAGSFSTITMPSLPAGLAWDTSALYTSGILTIVSNTGLTFAAWAAANGLPGATITGNHDGDAFNNGIEFAFGLFPAQPGTVEPTIELHNYGDGPRLRARFTRPLDRTGVTLKVQASDDLATWTDLATSINSAPFTGPGFVSENRAHPDSEPGLVEVRDVLTPSAAPRRFLRIAVTPTP